MATAEDIVERARAALHELRQYTEGDTDEMASGAFEAITEAVQALGLDPGSACWRGTMICCVTLVEMALQAEGDGPAYAGLMAVRAALLYLAFWPDHAPLPR